MKNRVINWIAFTVLALLWLGFGIALAFSPRILQSFWELFRGWNLIAQALVGLLTLPVVVGLWAWNASWPIWLRLVIVIGLAWATLYAFFPKKQLGTVNPSITS